MFSSALKSFSSNISSNYTIAPQPSSTAGPWKVFDAKRKTSGKAASVFVFDKKSLETQGGGLGGRSSGSSVKRAHEEVLDRLKKEASSLARLRHPSILELAEPVEETRNGGLMFATEAVTCSLAQLLQEKDNQERSGGRASRYVVEESDGTRRRRELEIDEVEIQKGLLQLAKGLEFLHESAGLVHANLTPEAILINVKGDWKVSGLAFCGPHQSSNTATSFHPISLHEVLNHDPRLPRSVQLDLDYTSPDFVLDNQLTTSADLFSLGLLTIALYNKPHTSPLSVGGSLSSYKRVFSSSSTIPTQSNNFLVPSSNPLPPKMASDLLPRLVTRRAAQRLTAKEFQQASYFDNILVSTIRFLDELPAKTPNEKMQFLRGLPRIMSQFPKSVLEKKVLPALLEEMKDKDLLAAIMTNVFAMVQAMPTGKRAFTEKVVPKLREVFIANRSSERENNDRAKEAGLMVLLENMRLAAENCSGKEFRDDILPIILLAIESSTHALVDAALSTLPFILPVLDFTTIKGELFPVIAAGFSKTTSLLIKTKALEAFYTLCGGQAMSESTNDDDLNGIGVVEKKTKPSANSCILDKYTIQEKVVPLLKGIKTKEPVVMMAALRVFRQVGDVTDTDFLAMEILPTLWSMSLGPLLDLQQFQAFMSLIKTLGNRIEREHTKKLQELSTSNGAANSNRIGKGIIASGPLQDTNGITNGDEADFETLVSGRRPAANGGDLMNDWGASSATKPTSTSAKLDHTLSFSWQTPVSTSQTPQASLPSLRPPMPTTRTVTPDLASFTALTPNSQYSQPLQPQPSQPQRLSTSNTTNMPLRPVQQTASRGSSLGTSVDWSAAASNSASWSNQRPPQQPAVVNGFGSASRTTFNIPPPPISPQAIGSGQPNYNFPSFQTPAGPPPQQQPPKNGLDKYESLL